MNGATPLPALPKEKKYDIPTVSFRIITDDKSLLSPAGVHSEQARSYGYNDFSDFERPEHYMRYIEPIESELAVQVEYDMDEQDQEWLDAINVERKKDQSGPVSYEAFEIIMDKLEKEWFNLIKRIPQPVSHLPVEDSKCAICDDGEGENSNAIVFCDGCNLAVHQDCYGVPYIPEGQWLCRKCTVSPENPVSCLFCPNEGGAFKQTTSGHWSHLLCAIWIPELGVGNAIYMEPVEGVELVPKSRWKLVCSLCKERVGACIQCVNKNCFTAFHVTCARQMGLLQSMKLMGDGQLESYCEKHLPIEWREGREDEASDANDTDYHDSDEDSAEEVVTPAPRKRARKDSSTAAARPAATTVTPKTARAHAKSYRPGPPIVPKMIINRLMEYVGKIAIRKRQAFIERLCRYWSLKREARRGAPLLKRLHLEPWTATSESREQTEAEKAKELEFLVALRNDLEKVRLLAELVRKREKEKLRQAQVLSDIVDEFILVHFNTLRATFQKIVAMDRGELFLNPVTVEDAPDYFDVIKEPMCWSEIEAKLDTFGYLNVDEFKHDVHLVLSNAMLYNKGETPFHRVAARIKKNSQLLLDELEAVREESRLLPVAANGESELVMPEPGAVGDIETSLLRLSTLLSSDAADDSRDILASIFISEVDKPKDPIPVAPTPTPPVEAPKPIPRKGGTAAERKSREVERRAASAKALREKRAAEKAAREQGAAEKAAADQAAAEQAATGEATTSTETETSRSNKRKSETAAEKAARFQQQEAAYQERLSLGGATRTSRGVVVDEALVSIPPSVSTPPPIASGSTRSARKAHPLEEAQEQDAEPSSAVSSPGTIKPMPKPQRGVLGLQSVHLLSDQERRAREKDLELVTDSVDSLDEYKRFNVGWILPEGSKRRRPPPPPLTLKKTVTPKSSSSRLKATSTEPSVHGTEASADSKATPGGGVKLELGPETAAPQTVNLQPVSESSRRKRKLSAALEADEEDAADNDERAKRAKPTTTTTATTITLEDSDDDALTPIPDSAARSAATENFDIADRTSLSPLPAVTSSPVADEGPTSGAKRAAERKAAKAKASPDADDLYPPGTQVWAKITSYPYFPAVVVDHVGHWETVPQAVLDLEDDETKAHGRVWLARFYDKQRSYGWMPAEKLDRLGVDDEVDQIYLAGKERNRKSTPKRSHMKAACKKAYEVAKEALADAGGAAGEASGSGSK